jgi:rabenosyn-5
MIGDFVAPSLAEGSMAEGFLCPICMQDLGEAARLQVHFDEAHSREDVDLLRELKGFFGKAKKKILNQDEEVQDSLRKSPSDLASLQRRPQAVSTPASGRGGSTAWALLPPEPEDYHPVTGVLRSHLVPKPSPKLTDWTGLFMEERRRRLDRNKSASQVLVRLERLLDGIPSDPSGRRAHEQRIVPWVDEELVKLCPQCGKSFGLKRRKHHCRLCGGVLCGDCSTAVDFDSAKVATNPASLADFDGDSREEGAARALLPSQPKGLRRFRVGSHESLNSLVGLVEQHLAAEPRFRSCKPCFIIVERHRQRSEAAAGGDGHPLANLYNQLKHLINDSFKELATYHREAKALNGGEAGHNLRDAKLRRLQLLRTAEMVDAVSKKIATLGAELPQPPGSTQLMLQMRIRQGAINFVKQELVGLPDVPSEEEYEALKKERIRQAQAKVEEERRETALAKAKLEREDLASRRLAATKSILSPGSSVPPSQPIDSNVTPVKYGSGFMLSSTASPYSSDDPMVQQIRNIRHFISEARSMGKHDEVTALEENLRELQLEYQRRQKEKLELEQNYDNFKVRTFCSVAK